MPHSALDRLRWEAPLSPLDWRTQRRTRRFAGPWLNLMRNSVNAQIFSFGHRDFLVVSATHGTAHLALFRETMWDKYKLAALAGTQFRTNTLSASREAATAFADLEDPESVFGPAGDTIPALQGRGVVFLACHNAIWELAGTLISSGLNPDHTSHQALAAELSNHLIDGRCADTRNGRHHSGTAAGRPPLCGVNERRGCNCPSERG